jgi:uncharacterized membrane protein
MPSRAWTYTVSVMALAWLLGLVSYGRAFDTHVSFCNHTPDPIEVAVGYDAEGTSETTSRGWFSVAACQCHDVINAQTRGTDFFTLVTKKGSDTVISSGQAPLCVHPTQVFKFVGENASKDSCHKAGGRWLNFSSHDTKGATSFKTNFTSDGHHCNL